MSENIDLSQLAVDRREPERPKPTHGRRRWVSRYALPLAMVLSFLALLAWAAKDTLLPAQPVTVVPVVVAKAQLQAGTPLFQAVGWIEPRPVSVVVSSLAPGVVEELLVVEGQSVKRGEPLARLLDTDARMRLNEARADRQLREADVETAQAESTSARLALENPIKLQAELADAQSALAKLDADLSGLPAALEAARTRRALAEQNVEKKRLAGDAIAGRILREAKAESASTRAAVQQLEARHPVMIRQREALSRKAAAQREKLKWKLSEQSRLAGAQAALKAAQARSTPPRLAVEAAELQLQRMTIASPIDGRVFSLQAVPGKRVVGIDPHSEKGSSAIATLYDPHMLQTRVDVRLEDVPQVRLGQPVRIETASLPEELDGQVISVTSRADIQKNTLQVKVAITDPPDVIRPEMLAQVTFLALQQPGTKAEASQERLRLLVPRQLVSSGEQGAHVWLADLDTKTARRQAVTLGQAGTAELIEITSGVTPTDKIISGGREGISDGQRIRITADDATLGIAAANAPASRTSQSQTTTQKTQ